MPLQFQHLNSQFPQMVNIVENVEVLEVTFGLFFKGFHVLLRLYL